MAKTTDVQAVAAPVRGDYWSQSRRPLASLLFAGPLLAIYETGLICLDRAPRGTAADAWLRERLKMLGFRQELDYFLLPVLTVGILLAWHYVSRQPWRVSRKVLAGMAGECLALAAALWLSWGLYQFFLHAMSHTVRMDISTRPATRAPSRTGWGPSTRILARASTKNSSSA